MIKLAGSIFLAAIGVGAAGQAAKWTEISTTVLQTLKDENPKIVTISKGYREPTCFDTTKRSLIR